MAAKPADADALPDAPADHAGADRASGLVAGDRREGKFGPSPFDCEAVAMAFAVPLDTDTHLTARRLRHIPLDELQRPPDRATCTARIFAIAAS
jgi:hypothetical protein